jgi:hypothetical protein
MAHPNPSTRTKVQVPCGETVSWQPRAALQVRVVAGRAWITWQGEPDDHFLDAGASMLLPAGCRALVGAETALSLVVEPQAASGAWSPFVAAALAVRTRWRATLQRRGRPIATP